MTTAPTLWAFVAETRTGRVVDKNIPLAALPRAGYRINTEGPLSLSVPMSKNFNKRDITGYLYPWYYSFGIAFGSFIVQYGPMVTQPEYDAESEEWQITCAGIWKMFNDKRYLTFTRDYQDLSLRDIARTLISDDLAQVQADLPIDLPALDGGGGHERFYPWPKLSPVGELLKNITDDVGGPEMEFRPYFTDSVDLDMVRHRFTTGTPFLGQQTEPHRWYSGRSLVVAAPMGGGDRIADLYIVPGAADGINVFLGSYNALNFPGALCTQGWPFLMDLDSTHTSTTEQVTLDAYAAGNYNAFWRGSRIVRARVRANPRDGEGPRISEWELGDLAEFHVTGYIGVPDGVYTCRIIGADLATLEDLDLELQLIGEELS
jgi:hypothetical protein